MASWLQRGVQWLTPSRGGAKTAKAAPSASPAGDPWQAAATEMAAPGPGLSAPAVPVTDGCEGVILEMGQPVFTKTPQLVIAGLPPGVHTFTLEVTDNLGACSGPVSIQVQVNPAASDHSGPGQQQQFKGLRR
jgi:hypothetical protein